ncbi:MAG: TonB family protein [Bdellovibrionales bacterium]
MKKFIYISVLVHLIGGVILYFNHRKTEAPKPVESLGPKEETLVEKDLEKNNFLSKNQAGNKQDSKPQAPTKSKKVFSQWRKNSKPKSNDLEFSNQDLRGKKAASPKEPPLDENLEDSSLSKKGRFSPLKEAQKARDALENIKNKALEKKEDLFEELSFDKEGSQKKEPIKNLEAKSSKKPKEDASLEDTAKDSSNKLTPKEAKETTSENNKKDSTPKEDAKPSSENNIEGSSEGAPEAAKESLEKPTEDSILEEDGNDSSKKPKAPSKQDAKISFEKIKSSELPKGFKNFFKMKQRRGNPPIAYPDFARRNKMEGQIILHYFISKEGIVNEISLRQSSGYSELDKYVLKLLALYEFLPDQETWVEHRLNFVLQGEQADRLQLRHKNKKN